MAKKFDPDQGMLFGDSRPAFIFDTHPRVAEELANGSRKWEVRKTVPVYSGQCVAYLWSRGVYPLIVGEVVFDQPEKKSVADIKALFANATPEVQQGIERFLVGCGRAFVLPVVQASARSYNPAVQPSSLNKRHPGFRGPNEYGWLPLDRDYEGIKRLLQNRPSR